MHQNFKMGLNKSKGQMYNFVTHTFNVIKGKCSHDCSYCYMKRWGEQKNVHFDDKELKTDLGENNFIFVGSSCDMFAEDIPSDWIIEVLDHCSRHNNEYLFQTKNPRRFSEFFDDMKALGLAYILCTTLESNRCYEAMQNSPHPKERIIHFGSTFGKKMITIEPIMDFDLEEFVTDIRTIQPFQVNIGAESGNHNLPEPNKKKILALIHELEKFTIVHGKKNIMRLLK